MALCSHCRRTLLRRLHHIPSHSLRYASTVPSIPNTPPAKPHPPTVSSTAPEAISSANPASSQPLSTPHVAPVTVANAAKAHRKGPRIPSKVVGGSPLKGLGYTKATPTIMAKEDQEYPEWLWTLLDQPKQGDAEVPEVDVSKMTKKQRAKWDRKQERLRSTIPKAIPLHEQSMDLTGPEDDAITSLERRQELTKSARVARRKSIREDNFLRSM